MAEPTQQRPWYRSASLLAALALVVVAILALAVVGVTSLLHDDRRTPPVARSTAPASPVTSAPSGRCPSDTAAVLNAPPQVQWRAFEQVLLPDGGSMYGPCQTTTTAAGYARTPGGALVAAVQIFRPLIGERHRRRCGHHPAPVRGQRRP